MNVKTVPYPKMGERLEVLRHVYLEDCLDPCGGKNNRAFKIMSRVLLLN
jgi:hypothetical protein